jgi:hypothetical protein
MSKNWLLSAEELLFIPDSAVELKMPEARWNPEQRRRPTVKFQSGFALSHVVAMRLKTSLSKHR